MSRGNRTAIFSVRSVVKWYCSVLLVFFFVPFAFAGSASAPPTPSVIVKNTDANPVPVTVIGEQGGKDIVQIFTLSEGDQGPSPYNGWQVLSGDGTVTYYRDGENPLVVPEGTILVITDFHSSFSFTGDGYISLEISQGDTRIRIYSIGSPSYATESRFVSSVHEAMTTGVIVPAGWQLDLPAVSGFPHDPPFHLQGYFTSVE